MSFFSRAHFSLNYSYDPITLLSSSNRAKLAFEAIVKPGSLFTFPILSAFCLLLSAPLHFTHAQEAVQKPAAKRAEPAAVPAEPQLPAQIELLETRIRFETNGDSRKEVHTRVRIINELGVRQFARLNFDFNRAFQSVEIPLVRITHPSGGTADILPSAITDNPNPAVVNAPAYQDVRVKSVRILGLEPGDLLEYRVITTVSHHPLAPDFWFDHSFDRTGVVSQEIFELDLPSSLNVQVRINPETAATDTSTSGDGETARKLYRWERASKSTKTDSPESSAAQPDVSITTFASWRALAERLVDLWGSPSTTHHTVESKAAELTKGVSDPDCKMQLFYEFVSKEIRTVDLPLDSMGFRSRNPEEILSSSYGTPLDKLRILDRLSYSSVGDVQPAFLGGETKLSEQLPLPSLLVNAVGASFILSARGQTPDRKGGMCDHCGTNYWLDPSLEVAPLGMLRADERGKTALFLGSFPGEIRPHEGWWWRQIPDVLPFPSTQRVDVTASLAASGTLSAKVKYILRGDNELLLRVAFHQSPKEKWKDLAQLLSISDGFRGQVSNVTTSDPYATREPFTIEYEITMPKFVDWSKKPVRIPTLLPQVTLPDPPAKPVAGAAVSPIELGTPLDVETHATLHLPPGTTARTPTGTSVQRDYATFTSQYAAKGFTITSSRHINFLLREVSAARVADYNAFLRAVQNDQAQDFTLERPEPLPAKPQSTAEKSPNPKKP